MKREIRLEPTACTREDGQVHQLRQSFILQGECSVFVYSVLLEMPYNPRDMAFQELAMIQSESLRIHTPRSSRISYDVETCEFYDVCYRIPTTVALMEEFYTGMVVEGSEGVFSRMVKMVISLFGEQEVPMDAVPEYPGQAKRILEL